MSTSSKDLLVHAQGLRGHTPEARRRAMISRAYYAAYHRCREWAKSLPRPAPSSRKVHGVHQQLIERLADPPKSCPARQMRVAHHLAKQLTTLRERRVMADYKLWRDISEEEMRNQQREAKEVFDCCDGWHGPRAP